MHIKYLKLIRYFRENESSSNFGTQYIIEPSDSLYEISLRFNTTVDKLKELNNLKSDLLQPGEIIIIDNIYNPENPPLYRRYLIKKNDTLYSIAYNYGMTPNEILEINNMLVDDIKEGQTIFLYNNPPLLGNETLYTVKQGDTLYSIAKEYNTTVDKIKNDNHLDDDALTPNTKLILFTEDLEPDEEIEKYIVIPGDSLYSISQKKGISIEELKKINNLTSDHLTIGQPLLVPKENQNERYR